MTEPKLNSRPTTADQKLSQTGNEPRIQDQAASQFKRRIDCCRASIFDVTLHLLSQGDRFDLRRRKPEGGPAAEVEEELATA